MARLGYGWVAVVDAFDAGLLATAPVRLETVITIARDRSGRPMASIAAITEARVEPCGLLAWRPSTGTVRYEFEPYVDFLQPQRFSVSAPALARRLLRDPSAPEHVVLDALLGSADDELHPAPPQDEPAVPRWLLYSWQPGPVYRELRSQIVDVPE
jgi:hypothetical protein